MAWRDSNGYYWFVGRNDDVIKCSGYRIGPLRGGERPAGAPCGGGVRHHRRPDPIRGQVVKGPPIVLAKGFEGTPELTKELQNHVKHATAPYKYPPCDRVCGRAAQDHRRQK